MVSTTLDQREAVLAAADAGRRRLRRRRLIVSGVSAGSMVLLIIAAAVFAVGFTNSWWVQSDPRASSNQQAADGSSVFTQAGIDYFTRVGVVEVTMTPSRPGAAALGLPRSGSTHIDFMIPLKVRAVGDKPVQLDLVDGIDILTAQGRVSAIEITDQGTYRGLLGGAQEFAARAGWSDTDLATLHTDLDASRLQHHAQSYSATIGPATSTGMPISATLSADAKTAPHLVIRIGAEP